jgi:hypothetical protein
MDVDDLLAELGDLPGAGGTASQGKSKQQPFPAAAAAGMQARTQIPSAANPSSSSTTPIRPSASAAAPPSYQSPSGPSSATPGHRHAHSAGRSSQSRNKTDVDELLDDFADLDLMAPSSANRPQQHAHSMSGGAGSYASPTGGTGGERGACEEKEIACKEQREKDDA